MASIVKVYNASKLLIHTEQNGELTVSDFNVFSELSELKMIDWLTGKPGADGKPIITPYDNQKNKDWLAPVIIDYSNNVVNGTLSRPSDYYYYDSLAKIVTETDYCEEGNPTGKRKEVPIDLLSKAQFDRRVSTSIELLKPKNKPCAHQIGKGFKFAPEDIGGVVLYYICIPKYGKLAVEMDEQFNEEIPDEDSSQNYVWGDWAIPILSWMIADCFANRFRDVALKNMNTATGKIEQ